MATDIKMISNLGIFCDKCDNILDISRTNTKTNTNSLDSTDTPKELSDSDNDDEVDKKDSDSNQEMDVDYELLLKKIESGKKLTNDELKMIDIKDMVKNEYYKKMSKKGEIKKMLIEMIDDMGNSDDNTQAYLVCKNCGFSKNIDSGFRVLTKNPEGIIANHDYTNDAFLRTKIHIRTMPRTRNFNCPNKNCPVYKNKLAPEAIFFRKNAKSYETIYACCHCRTIKMN